MKGDDGGNEPIQTVRNTKYIFLKIIQRKHFKFCHAIISIYFVIVKVRSQNMIMLVWCLKKKNCFKYVFSDKYFQLSYLSMDKGNLQLFRQWGFWKVVTLQLVMRTCSHVQAKAFFSLVNFETVKTRGWIRTIVMLLSYFVNLFFLPLEKMKSTKC